MTKSDPVFRDESWRKAVSSMGYKFCGMEMCQDPQCLDCFPEKAPEDVETWLAEIDDAHLTETFHTIGEADPGGMAASEPGAKMDAGKAPVVRGLLQYFPRACEAVATLSAKGAEKYAWNGWESVEDGINRYADACGRHQTKEAIEGLWDNGEGGTGELHKTAVAWNALAALELQLRELEEK